MRKIIKEKKGLTLIEILVSTVLLVIVAAMSYSVFLSIASMGSYSRDELEAKSEISGWIEQVRSGKAIGGSVVWTDLNDAGSMMQTDYKNNWPLCIARPSVTALNAEYNIDTGIQLNTTPAYSFKRVNMHVEWDERR